MKRLNASSILFFVLVVAVFAIGLMVQNSQASENYAPDAWFWTDPKPLQQVFLGDFDNQMIVVEGQIGNQVEPLEWNIYVFGDGGDFDIRANFADNMPASVLPQNTTVRLIGVPEDGEMSVEGIEIMGGSSAQPDATIGQINSGVFDQQDVAVRGQVGNQINAEWKYYDFSDDSDTTVVDFEDNLPESQTPKDRSIIVYGEVKNDGGSTRRIDNDTMLLAGEGDPQPTVTPTNPASTATATGPAPTATATGSAPTATATAVPGANDFTYLPVIFTKPGTDPQPTPTPTATTPPTNNWVWDITNTVAQIKSGCCSQQIVVVEGTITGKNNDNNPNWNEYDFNDATGTLILDFEDEIAIGAIPLNQTVRILGEVDDQNYVKIEVDGLQVLAAVSQSPSHTAAQINTGNYENVNVSLKGEFGDLVDEFFLLFAFTDTSGTTDADIGNNDIPDNWIPQNRTLMIYGEGSEEAKVNVDYILIANGY